MRVVAALRILALCVLATSIAAAESDEDRSKSLRKLEKKARELEAAAAKLVTRCRRCGGDGKLRREGQRVTCVDCKGNGRKVSKVFYTKIFWNMRSNRYRKTSGHGPKVRSASYEVMQQRATPIRTGAFHSVETLDDHHAISWHKTDQGEFVYYRWIHEAKHGWALYTSDFDGPWPDSNIGLGYPGAKVSEFVVTSYDKFKGETRVMTKPFDVGSGLRFAASFHYKGARATGVPGDVLFIFMSSSKSWRFLARHEHQIHLLADRGPVPLGRAVHAGDVVSGGVKETVGASIKRAELARVIDASHVEGRIGLEARFGFTPVQRRIVGELLRRYDIAIRPHAGDAK